MASYQHAKRAMLKFCFVIFLALTLQILPALAETSIAVIDVQKILIQSNASKNIEEQIAAYKEKVLNELTRQEQSLRDDEKRLTEEKPSLSKEAFAEKAKKLEEKFVEIGSLTQSKKRVLDKVSSRSLDQVREKLYEIVQAIAKEKGYNLVITKQNVVVGEQSIDITDDALKLLNEDLPSVPLDFTKE